MRTIALAALAALTATAYASDLVQSPPGNYDESKVPAYTLPDPLVRDNGQRVTTAAAWTTERRPELLRRLNAPLGSLQASAAVELLQLGFVEAMIVSQIRPPA